MAGILDKINNVYVYINDDLQDPRTKHLPLMSSPLLMFVIVMVYLKFCISYGPRLMKNKPAYELKTPIMLYNVFQILFSIFLVSEGFLYMFSKDYNLVCDPITNTDDPRVNRTAVSTWWYFFAKITELLETIFFVFRKKNNQISTLHLYHHSMVVFTAWLAAKFFPVGPIVLVGTLNSLVHTLMYTYYFLAGLGPQYQKYLWWKRHLTLIQLIQFVIIITHNSNALLHDCNYPKMIHVFILGNAAMLFYLFSKFYYRSYIKVKPKKVEEIHTVKGKEGLKTKRKSISVGQ